jgi:hypothetical protein
MAALCLPSPFLGLGAFIGLAGFTGVEEAVLKRAGGNFAVSYQYLYPQLCRSSVSVAYRAQERTRSRLGSRGLPSKDFKARRPFPIRAVATQTSETKTARELRSQIETTQHRHNSDTKIDTPTLKPPNVSGVLPRTII